KPGSFVSSNSPATAPPILYAASPAPYNAQLNSRSCKDISAPMRTSQFLLSTLKETPSDAVVISHQLMLRAGMIRRLASGLYTWMPMGLRALRKAEAIARDEMKT